VVKKLVLIASMMAAFAGAQAADDFRNPAGGNIAQYTNPQTAKADWQIVFADGKACQKFIGLFDSKPDVLKYAVDCWGNEDSASADLKTKLAVKGGLTLEAVSPTVKDNSCAAAVVVLKDVGVEVTDACPAQPTPAPSPTPAPAASAAK